MSQSYFSNHKKGVIGCIIFFCVTVVILTFLHTSFTDVTKRVYPELYAWNIIPKPESFTELYFENHEKLPFEILPQQTYSFLFTIRNQENRSMIYPYDAYIAAPNKKIMLQQGSIALTSGQKKTIAVNFSTSSELAKSKIIVNLPKKNQDIDFLINQ